MPVAGARAGLIGCSFVASLVAIPSAFAVGVPAKADDSVKDEPQADATPVVVEVQSSPRRAHLFGRVTGAFVYRWALKESLIGGAFEAEVGARDHRWAAGGRLRVEAGKMLAGLPYQVITIGPSLWFPPLAGRVHFGMGVEGGALLLDRRTEPGTVMWTVIWGGRLDASLDLVRIGEHGGIYFGTSVSAQALTTAPFPVTVATGFSIGYRP